MIKDTFLSVLEREFPFSLTALQREAAVKLGHFLFTPDAHGVFILRGYAGTGKTTLVASLVKVLRKIQQTVVLMAPTGRAAKVFSIHADYPAFTIHKVIYRQKRADDIFSGFSLNHNKYHNTLFIVDEASMIGTEGGTHPFFGSGQLLDDIFRFVYSGVGCRLLFIGDTAQLPPVGEEESPALNDQIITNYGFHVISCELTEVMRQAQESGILYNATQLRHHITSNDVSVAPVIRLSGFSDINNCPGTELIDALEKCYDDVGTEQTIVITRSNKRANIYNRGIRASIFGREEGLSRGDVVMVAKNNYYWTEQLQAHLPEGETLPMDFIANGDIAIVRSIHQFHDFYDLHFADITLRFPDYDDLEMDVRVILDTLTSESPALTQELSEQLFQGIMEDYAEYPTKKKRMEKLRMDPNYNAVQIKYAYAVTCHKAQGGQWHHVFIDQGWLPSDGIDKNYYRWLYTAFTRSSYQLQLVNWPEKQQE